MAEEKPIDLDTIVDLDAGTDAQLDKATKIEKVLTVEEIKNMIAQLSVTEEGESLRTAMDDLKKGIRDNPEACAVLLPEEIGDMVKALNKITGRDLEKAVEKAKSGKRTKKSSIDLSSKEVQQEILDDL